MLILIVPDFCHTFPACTDDISTVIAGRQSARWHGKNNTGEPIASGLYIYRLQIETTVFSRKMVLLR